MQDCPPCQFAPLIAKDQEKKQTELQRQKHNLEVLVKAEEIPYDKKVWTPCSGCLGLHRFRPQCRSPRSYFQTAPTRLASSPARDQRAMQNCFQGSRPLLEIERGFKDIKDGKRKNSRKHVNRRIRLLHIPIKTKMVHTVSDQKLHAESLHLLVSERSIRCPRIDTSH